MKTLFRDSIGLLLTFCMVMGFSALRIVGYLPQVF